MIKKGKSVSGSYSVSGKLSPVNLLLCLFSIIFTYALLEFLLIPLLMETASLKTQALFPPAMRILSQSSKHSLIPNDYVLILGDSYAIGKGDWFLSVDKEKNPPFHSAHVIHDKTGKDVITFGESGADSITATATMPVRRFRALQRFAVEAPETVLIYFYEGNDVTDNVGYLRRHYYAHYNKGEIYSPDYFQMFLEHEVKRKTLSKKFTDKLYLAGYIIKLYKALKDCIEEICWTHGDAAEQQSVLAAGTTMNKARIDGELLYIPNHLQSPALELDENELDLSLYVMEQSLIYLMNYFHESQIHIIYIPSPLSSYGIVSEKVSIQSYAHDATVFPAEDIMVKGKDISHGVEMIAMKHGAGFLDITPRIRDAGASQILHGPNDWRHFNETGYRILGNEIAQYLKERGVRRVNRANTN